jgi:hypothetical protein
MAGRVAPEVLGAPAAPLGMNARAMGGAG